MLTVTPAEIQDALMKPVQLTTVINGLIALETANVISSSVSANVVNAMFDDISTSTALIRAQVDQLVLDLKAQSEYLYGATDEINETIGANANNAPVMATHRATLSNLYDQIRDGFSNSTTVASTVTSMNTDFWGPSALYKTNYKTMYPASTYSTTTIANFASNVVSANTLLASQTQTLDQLKIDYPTMSIEAAGTKTATYLPEPDFYVKLIDGTDYFYIYTNGGATVDIGNRFPVGSLIAKPGTNYAVHVLNTGSTNPAENNRRLMIMSGVDQTSANVYFTAQGNSNTVIGSHITSIAFEGVGGNIGIPEYTILPDGTLNGRNAVIDNV